MVLVVLVQYMIMTRPQAPVTARAALIDEHLNESNAEVLREYFSACESDFRGHVVRTHPDLTELWKDLERCAVELVQAIAEEYPSQKHTKEGKIVAKNGLVYLAKKPTEEGAVKGVEYYHPYDDKKQKRLGGYTSQGVAKALDAYKGHVERAPRVVENVLQDLCERLDNYQMTVLLISNCPNTTSSLIARGCCAEKRMAPTHLGRLPQGIS